LSDDEKGKLVNLFHLSFRKSGGIDMTAGEDRRKGTEQFAGRGSPGSVAKDYPDKYKVYELNRVLYKETVVRASDVQKKDSEEISKLIVMERERKKTEEKVDVQNERGDENKDESRNVSSCPNTNMPLGKKGKDIMGSSSVSSLPVACAV
jgi:hypothetical protein